jgi:hypothetical protein
VFGILAKIVAVQFLDFLILARKWSGLTCNRSRTAKVSHFEHPFDPKKTFCTAWRVLRFLGVKNRKSVFVFLDFPVAGKTSKMMKNEVF